MANCTSRGRVKKTLAHEQPDRVPIDIGGDAQWLLSFGTVSEIKEVKRVG